MNNICNCLCHIKDCYPCVNCKCESVYKISSLEKLIGHSHDGIERCFDKIEGLEKSLNSLTDMYKHLSICIAQLQDYKIKNDEENKELNEKMKQLQDLTPRVEMLEHQIKYVMKEIKRLSENDSKCWRGCDDIDKRIEKLESNQLGQHLDPKVWVFVNERLDKLEGSPFSKSDIYVPLFERLNSIEKAISNWEEEFYFLKDKLRSPDSKLHKYCYECGKKND